MNNKINIQALFDGMSKQWQRERAESQMTLGTLITRLEAMSKNTLIELLNPHSYRGYYEDLAFEGGTKIKVSAALKLCKGAMGKVFEGYKGGDFVMGERLACTLWMLWF